MFYELFISIACLLCIPKHYCSVSWPRTNIQPSRCIGPKMLRIKNYEMNKMCTGYGIVNWWTIGHMDNQYNWFNELTVARLNKSQSPYFARPCVLFFILTTLTHDPCSDLVSIPGPSSSCAEHDCFRSFGPPSGYVGPIGLKDKLNCPLSAELSRTV